MTDRTHPDSGRATDQTHIIRYALELGLLWIDGDGRGKVREALDALAALEAQLEAIRAGGVNGPLMGQPQAMPDLSQLKERGAVAWAVAWAGVDAQGLREGRWYMVTHDGVATLCEDRRDAEKEAKDADMAWPHSGPHRAMQLVEASTAGFTAADMATASAQGFRDGVASISANAGEPTCDMRTVVAVAVTMLYDTHPEDVCRVFDRNDLETIVSITEPLGHGRVEDIYRDAWDHVAAPPTAQAAGSAVLKAIREANMQLVRTGDNAFMLVPYKAATAQAAESVPAVSDLPPLPDPDLRDVGTKPQEIKDFLNGYATEYARLALASRAPIESVGRDAERLDFIGRHPEMSLRHRKGKWAFLGFTNYEYDLHPSLREAIDAAMAANGGNK